MDSDTNMKRTDWHALTVQDILKWLRTDAVNGLEETEARERSAACGANLLPSVKGESLPRKFLRQFNNVLIYVLLTGAGITALMEHWTDTVVILLVVVINALIGFIQENKAESALAGIRRILALQAHVLRGGKRVRLNAEQLTLGDIVFIKPGDRVPADMRLLRVSNLRVEEAALTGEAIPREKGIESIDLDAMLADRTNMVFSGTTVSAGTGVGAVTAIGPDTEVGKINQLIAEVQPLTTPLLKQIRSLIGIVAVLIGLMAFLVFFMGLLIGKHEPDTLLLSVIALTVAAIPEGLPATVSILLALGVQHMAKRNVIVRHLPSVETLGSVSVICSDKTGTLTKNEMTVTILLVRNAQFEVSGTGYAPEGEITRNGEAVSLDEENDLKKMLACFKVCNETTLEQDEKGQWVVRGEPTEGSLLTLWLKSGIPDDLPEVVESIPFDSAYKYMAVLVRGETANTVYIKGAPERLAAMLDGSASVPERDFWMTRADSLAGQGMRVLAAAYKEVSRETEDLSHEDLCGGITFLGLSGIIDPPREEAVSAIRICAQAGIQVKMITGDHLETARAIGKTMGISDGGQALEGRELEAMTEEDLRRAVRDNHIFARTSPEHKLHLVRALQANGSICAMTGDGVNDAPALKRANIGIAMGIKGTEVAKMASEIVLADDNFQSIAAAVEEGRKVYDNLRKTLLFLFATNLAESLIILVSIFFSTMLILTPVQVLWVNTVTAVTISLALAFEPIEGDAMRRPPRDPGAPLLTGYLIFRIIYVSLLMSGFALFLSFFILDVSVLSETVFRTIILQTIVSCELVYLFNMRYLLDPALGRRFFHNKMAFLVSLVLALLQLAVTYLPFLNRMLGTAPLALEHWGVPLLVALVFFLIVELEKFITHRLVGIRNL